jgi:hypothetical protein
MAAYDTEWRIWNLACNVLLIQQMSLYVHRVVQKPGYVGNEKECTRYVVCF